MNAALASNLFTCILRAHTYLLCKNWIKSITIHVNGRHYVHVKVDTMFNFSERSLPFRMRYFNCLNIHHFETGCRMESK